MVYQGNAINEQARDRRQELKIDIASAIIVIACVVVAEWWILTNI